MTASFTLFWWATIACFLVGYLAGFLRARYLFKPRPKLLTGKIHPPAPPPPPEPTFWDFVEAAAVIIPVVVKAVNEVDDAKKKPPPPIPERDVTPKV